MQLVTRWHLRDIESKEVWASCVCHREMVLFLYSIRCVDLSSSIWNGSQGTHSRNSTSRSALLSFDRVRRSKKLFEGVKQVWTLDYKSLKLMPCPFSISLPLNRIRVFSSCEKKHSKWNVYVPYRRFLTVWLLLDCLSLQVVNGLGVNRMQSVQVLELATQAFAVYSSHLALFTAWPSGTCKASY